MGHAIIAPMARVFITGASTGIGEGLARRYGVSGAVLGLVARRANLLEALAADLQKRGATVHVYAGDVGDTAWMSNSAKAFVHAAGGADVVIANAGIGIPDVARHGNASEIEKLFRINVIGVSNTVVPFIPSMLSQRDGVLAAVSSVLGWRAVPGRAPYCASKAGVISLMDGLRMDLHGTGVHAMTLCPGFVRTPMTASYDKMLWPIDSEEAVDEITRAIARRDRTHTFPWQMRILSRLMRIAPEWGMRMFAPPPRKE